jgi:peptide/nickel transport system ATP-binding protein
MYIQNLGVGGPPLLSVEKLRTEFLTRTMSLVAVDNVDISVSRGKTLGIVGESGCGKSALSLSIMGLLPKIGRITAGRIMLDGRDIANAPPHLMRMIRGKRIAMIFQEPMASLDPLQTVGTQIGEAIQTHDRSLSRKEVHENVIGLLRKVRIPSPERRAFEYPHQMSGGMRQRIMIAMALACKPDILIADEPTTALDVTVQAEILRLLRQLQKETGMAIILITHDLGVVAEMADEIVVMYAGRVLRKLKIACWLSKALYPGLQRCPMDANFIPAAFSRLMNVSATTCGSFRSAQATKPPASALPLNT